jgi:ferredoxin/nitrate reductase gamma subunit
MTTRVDPGLLIELKQYGRVDVETCFNCGNCTAICPLTTDEENFPRRLIRYAQLGLKDRLIASKDIWLCYYCGECSTTCPRQANPGEFMTVARRYAIAQHDVTGLAGALYRSAWFNAIFTIVLTIFFSLFLLSVRQSAPIGRLALFEFIPEVYIQIVGVAVLAIMVLAALAQMVKMTRDISRVNNGSPHTRFNNWQALRITLLEVFNQERYRHTDCEEIPGTPWYLRKWVVHATILYGFLGLLLATALDFLFKPVGSVVPLFYPMRLLGTSVGLLLMYGTSLALIRRWKKHDESTTHSHHSDWTFLILMWLVGITGFVLEVAVYAVLPPLLGYAMLIVHIALAMDVLILLPFSKFAHAYYRSVALWLHNRAAIEQPQAQAATVEA